MDLHQLRCFVAVAEELHFRRAAARLFCSPSTVTVAVRQLERHVGTPLLLRTTRWVELTAAGESFLGRAYAVLDAVAALDPVELPTVRSGVLRVGVLDEGLAELTVPTLRAFRATCPGVAVEVRTLSYVEAVGRGARPDVDVVLAHGPLGVMPGACTALRHQPRVVMVSRAHPLADAAVAEPADVLDEPFLDSPELSPAWLGPYQLRDERGGERPRAAALPLRTFGDVQWAVLSGAVITVLATARTFFPHPDIAYVPLPAARELDVGIVVPPGRGSDTTRAFLAVARQVAAVERSCQPPTSAAGPQPI